jgi:RNA polymerase sigma factor (TIGR02999 family)
MSSTTPGIEVLYETLRELAAHRLGTPGGRRLRVDPTELVHEALLKLQQAGALGGRAREALLPLAARVLRQVLVDIVRRERAVKRGGDWQRVTLSTSLVLIDEQEVDVVLLDEALERLERLHPRQARIVELRYFAGLSVDETAAAVGVAPRTVDGDWKMARAWLKRELES